jgi:hypothetical protein
MGERVRAGTGHALGLGQLTHEHVLQADAAAFFGEGHGQLLVIHRLILLGGFGVQGVVLGQHVIGRTHGLEHFTKEQRLEFLGYLAQVGLAVAIPDFQRAQAIEVCISP